MMANCWAQEGISESISIISKDELEQFLDSFVEKEPFYCELIVRDSKLSICIRKDLGSVQHSPSSNAPPYLMAVTRMQHDRDDEIDFFIGIEATPISARYALPLADVKQIIRFFWETGHRDPTISWDSI